MDQKQPIVEAKVELQYQYPLQKIILATVLFISIFFIMRKYYYQRKLIPSSPPPIQHSYYTL